MARPPPSPTLFPYTTLFRSLVPRAAPAWMESLLRRRAVRIRLATLLPHCGQPAHPESVSGTPPPSWDQDRDRKSTRLNSSHVAISYAVFCLKKKKQVV